MKFAFLQWLPETTGEGVTKCLHCRFDLAKAKVHGSMSTEKLVEQKAMLEFAKRLEEEGFDAQAQAVWCNLRRAFQ